MFVNCLVKQFAMCLVVILLLHFMEGFSVCGEVRCWIYRVGSSTECECCDWECASKCSFHMLCLCFCMSEVSPHLRV